MKNKIKLICDVCTLSGSTIFLTCLFFMSLGISIASLSVRQFGWALFFIGCCINIGFTIYNMYDYTLLNGERKFVAKQVVELSKAIEYARAMQDEMLLLTCDRFGKKLPRV